MIRISNISFSASEDITHELIERKIKKKYNIDLKSFEISKKSIDARNKEDVRFIISVDGQVKNEKSVLHKKNVTKVEDIAYTVPAFKGSSSPVVVGFGPGGMFAALNLARSGAKPIVIERGESVEAREKEIEKFFKFGILNKNTNVQFGEGGAGTFSDGKLNTNINNHRCKYVLEEFVNFGAPKEILYDAKPHIGTDNLKKIVKNIRDEIIRLGGKIYFNCCMTDIVVKNKSVEYISVLKDGKTTQILCENVILAIGHSARDTFELLQKKGIIMEQKPFSVGVRIEHKQEFINRAQYGKFSEYLPAADYKLYTHLPEGRNVYSFCMCPGGSVIAAASEENSVVTNGMSYYSRDGRNANAALLVDVKPLDFGSENVLAGMYFQRDLERKAFIQGGSNYNAPIQTVGDFLNSRPTKSFGDIIPTYPIGTKGVSFKDIFPEYIYTSLQKGLNVFDKKIKGFACDAAVMTAVETRSSSPVRILRDDNFESLNTKGLYPCAEGCGYAGGIMSAAVDGLKCSEALINKYFENNK